MRRISSIMIKSAESQNDTTAVVIFHGMQDVRLSFMFSLRNTNFYPMNY
ncbi:hypothetical protein Cf24236_1350 [Citrobacter farmeri]|nr:hypothetical protein Cf24236_1350 [Citrobacter farmeri]